MALSTDKRVRILDAAVTVFADRGFFQSRVSDIADAAGVAGGTIYLYFKSKDDVLISLFEDRMEKIIERVKTELALVSDAESKLRVFVDQHLSMVQQHPQLAEVLIVELRQSSKFMREYRPVKFSEYLDLIESIVQEGVECQAFRAGVSPRLAKRMIFGALEEVSATWLGFRREGVKTPFDLQEAATEITDILAAGFRDSSFSEEDRSTQ